MVKVLNSVISPNQSGFLPGRQIMDCVLTANEIVSYLKAKRMKAFMFKVDFEKAFDCVEWPFLLDILKQMGFGDLWCKWILGCLNSASVSIILNGSPSNEFAMSRGLRQGDPLSPLLFLVVVEALQVMIKEACNQYIFNGVKLSNVEENLSLLQFADDALFFGKWGKSNLGILVQLLKLFQRASGLKVNLDKSKIYGIGVDMEQVHGVAAAFQCNFGELPFLYLGLPVGYNPRSARLWKPVIEKIEGRLSSWKGKFLSIGGRLTLLKAVLDAVPVYYLSLFKAPKCIISKIDGIRRQFLWGSKDGEKKICWVSWDKITLEKSKGGLGLKNLSDFNTSLIGKWAWRWKTEDSALWVQVIRAIYGESGGFGSDHFRRKNTVWSYIIGCCHDAKSIGIDIVGAIKRRVVTGSSTNFWADSWVSGVPSLKEVYPRLFALELEKNCRVADRRLWHEDKWFFSWQWRCQPRGRAAEALKGLETLLSNLEPIHGSGDSWYWSLDSKGEYSVKGLYKILSTHRNSSFGWRSMFSWNSWIPIKVNVMAWRACSNKLPTLDNLSKRGVRYNQNLCPFGCGVLESIDHTLCHCVNVEAVWKKVFSWWKLSFPSSFSWHFICSLLGKYSFASLSDRAFHGVCCVVIWLLWNRRNRLVFGEAGSTHRILEEDIFPCIQSKSLSWIKYRSKVCVGSWSNWVLNPMEVVL